MASESTSPKKEQSTRLRRWLAGVMAWIRLKRLQREFRSSEQFQRECEKLGCSNLAKMEESARGRIAERIQQLRD